MTSYLTLLLATLGIMIGLFTVTGFINRMGATLLELGAWNVMAMIGMAYLFGWLLGAGLPPTATYIIGAVIIVQPLVQLGINPWVAHFFVFLLSVWGELSPPTSLTAAISAKIADTSFMRTMWEALKMCIPITLMTFAIFTRPNMVTVTGWPQLVDATLVLISVCGISFAMFGRFMRAPPIDWALRIALAGLSFVVMFHPDTATSATFAVPLLIATIFGIWRHAHVTEPAAPLAVEQAASLPGDEELAHMMADARRDIG